MRRILPWVFLAVLCGTARAETPFVLDEWRYGRHSAESSLAYCLDKRDPDWPIAAEIGQSIAGALLLQAKPVMVEADTVGDSIDILYQALLGSCDFQLGFKLIPDAYPDWLTVTRPYYRTSYMLATNDAALHSLGDLPRNRAVASTLGTTADLRLIQYLLSMPASERWSRFPMSTDEAALRAVLSGEAAAALVWGPSFWALQHDDQTLASLKPLPAQPLPLSTIEVGAALLSRETYLRTAIDQAIAALLADGTIAGILAKNGFPGAPAS